MNKALLLAAAGGYLAYRALRPRYDFRGKHVLITGGARGLGLVMARQLRDAGARLTICSRTGEQLGRAAAELGPDTFAVECDVTDPARVREMVAVARQKFGPIDVLVNNAGMIRVGPVEEMRENDYEDSLRTHFWAAYHAMDAVVPEMKARRAGRIVNVSSFGGKIALPHLVPYSVGKFALVALSTGMRSELARHGVVVTTACPGLIRTGSHVNAEFKGRHEAEFAWFAVGNGMPGLSMSAEAVAREVLAACGRGDAEAVPGLPARLGVVLNALCPNLMASVMDFVNRVVMPRPGGIGTGVATGSESRGSLPRVFTALTDRAAAANNELRDSPPPLPHTV
jgi:NAD(P)-dependent dehydrogenase (short-subunit alcohol dehydrogenase family)